MLDYTLVSAKATYRLLTPQDMPIFLRMAQAARAETGPAGPGSDPAGGSLVHR